jgi:hypothetical protein
VLARTFEAAGLSTVLVTNMPFWAERIGAPRTLAVEFPFGHTLGQPHNVDQQMRVIRQALQVLETAQEAGTIIHSTETWPEPVEQAVQDWQPTEPSPVIAVMKTRFLELMRQRRRRAAGSEAKPS